MGCVEKKPELSQISSCLVCKCCSCWSNAGGEHVGYSWRWSLKGFVISCKFTPSCVVDLGFDFVLSLEHLIDFCQIISSLHNGFGIALGRIAFLQMCLFSKHAHLAHRQQVRPPAPNEIRLTSSYTSGRTVFLASNLSCKLRCLTIGLMSPATFILKKELARPLP